MSLSQRRKRSRLVSTFIGSHDMRIILEGEEKLDGEIVLDEIYVQLVGKKEEEDQVTDTTLQDMIKNILK
jgi:hypothetical protein